MEDSFGFDNILGPDEIETLFTDPVDETPDEQVEKPDVDDTGDEKNGKDNITEEIDPESLFADEESTPESVGSGKEKGKEKEDTSTGDNSGTSPNFYSSIAAACAVDGIFPNLDEEYIKKATTAEDFGDLIKKEVEARYDEGTKRVLKALENGAEPSDIQKYENTLRYISSITDQQLSAETDEGESLRKNVIYQDFLNRGYTPEKAQKFTKRTIDQGTDVEDAREALQNNKEFFQNGYNKLLKDAQDKADREREEQRQQSEKLRSDILTDKQLFGGMEISSDLRKKAFENASKPVYKDPNTGEYLTAFQRYQRENPGEFLKNSVLLFTLTNGFKDFKSFAKGEVKKEMKKGLRALEQTINSTSRDANGNLKMVTGVRDDPESFFKGLSLDV